MNHRIFSVLLLAALVGCNKGDDDSGDTDVLVDTDDTDVEVDTDDTDVEPVTASVEITSPVVNEDTYGSLTLTYEVSDFTLAPDDIGGTNVDGEGHVHWFLDNEYQDVNGTGSIDISGLTPGNHTLAVKLASNDHTELGPSDSVVINVLAPSITITSPTDHADFDVSAVELGFTIADFEMSDDIGGVAAIGEGHYHVFVDDAYVDLSNDPDSFLLTRLTEGMHTLKVELVNSDHTSLSPAASDSVMVEINNGAYYIELDRSPFTSDFDSATWPVEITTDNFIMDPLNIGGTNVAGFGHYHINVDGAYVDLSTDLEAYIYNQPAGQHVLSVELVNNDHSGTGAIDWVVVNTTADRPDIEITSPADGEALGSSAFTLMASVDNFTLDAANVGGTNAADTGHYHVYVDGVYYTFTTGTNTSVSGLTPGSHVISVELVNNDHSTIAPLVRDEITVTVPL